MTLRDIPNIAERVIPLDLFVFLNRHESVNVHAQGLYLPWRQYGEALESTLGILVRQRVVLGSLYHVHEIPMPIMTSEYAPHKVLNLVVKF